MLLLPILSWLSTASVAQTRCRQRPLLCPRKRTIFSRIAFSASLASAGLPHSSFNIPFSKLLLLLLPDFNPPTPIIKLLFLLLLLLLLLSPVFFSIMLRTPARFFSSPFRLSALLHSGRSWQLWNFQEKQGHMRWKKLVGQQATTKTATCGLSVHWLKENGSWFVLQRRFPSPTNSFPKLLMSLQLQKKLPGHHHKNKKQLVLPLQRSRHHHHRHQHPISSLRSSSSMAARNSCRSLFPFHHQQLNACCFLLNAIASRRRRRLPNLQQQS